MRFKDEVIIITGAAEGIGYVYAEDLAREGAKIMAAFYNKDPKQVEKIDQLLSSIREEGGEASAVGVDVSDEDSVLEMAEQTIEKFGSIDGLVNNACLQTAKSFMEYTSTEFDQMLAVNVKGVWLCIKAVYPSMKKKGKGKIVNIGSQTFFYGWKNLAPYVASKGGVVGLTRALARELGKDGIRLNCLCPGLTVTEGSLREVDQSIFPGRVNEWLDSHVQGQCIGHPGYPQDLTGALKYLLSDDSDFMTGQTMLVDGGWAFH